MVKRHTRIEAQSRDGYRIVGYLMRRRLKVPFSVRWSEDAPSMVVIEVPDIVDLTDIRRRLIGVEFWLSQG
jgi:hypothetical protein